jgi:MoaE-MoaD fusion protein
MTVRVRLFAILRERLGRNSLELELPEGSTVAEALAELSRAGLGDLLERVPVRMAVNCEYADPDTALRGDDELALVPPISGGADCHVRVTAEPLSIEGLASTVGHPAAGAVVVFQGMTRDVTRLEYEAYREMAERKIATILRECVDRYRLEAAAAEHRTGSVPLGEPSILVAVSAPHREEAFAAAREAIDRIKAEAPIWKREVDSGGSSRWVEGVMPRLPSEASE